MIDKNMKPTRIIAPPEYLNGNKKDGTVLQCDDGTYMLEVVAEYVGFSTTQGFADRIESEGWKGGDILRPPGAPRDRNEYQYKSQIADIPCDIDVHALTSTPRGHNLHRIPEAGSRRKDHTLRSKIKCNLTEEERLALIKGKGTREVKKAAEAKINAYQRELTSPAYETARNALIPEATEYANREVVKMDKLTGGVRKAAWDSIYHAKMGELCKKHGLTG